METGEKTQKRRRQESDAGEDGHVTKKGHSDKDRQYNLYIIKNKLTSGHLAHLKTLSLKNGLSIAETFNNTVTHIVTALPSLERVKQVLRVSDFSCSVEVVTIEWLTTSFVEGKPVQVTDRYRLKGISAATVEEAHIKKQKEKEVVITEYECQRPTLLEHNNVCITEALEVLEKYYQHFDHKQGDTRALAFRQASCTIKALPRKVERVEEVKDLHRIGKHSCQVIEEIVTCGCSKEVEEIRNSAWFQCMELFTSVYGCGPVTANKWYNKGHRTIAEVKECDDIDLTENQTLGLLYYEELSQPILRAEVELIIEAIKSEVSECCPGASVEAVGGYRRGKPRSHDVDLLLSHEDSEIVLSLLETIISHLKTKNILLHANVTIGQNAVPHIQATHHGSAHSSYTSGGQQIKRVQFDHLDKAFCILKLNQSDGSGHTIMRRVDIIVVPPEQYPFALVSWTGSKFNRSLRRYSVHECSKSVTAHGIYDILERKFLPAKSEKDIFEILKLDYLEPWERNC